jgi:hypothetical protein
MAIRPVGICNDTSAAAATSFHRIELNPGKTIYVTEFGISLNAAPDSTAAPISWAIERSTTVGTGTAGTIVNMNDEIADAPATTALVENSADGTSADILHRLYVPNVSGVIWVAAPGREFDCIAAEFVSILNEATLPTGVNANTYMIWEE